MPLWETYRGVNVVAQDGPAGREVAVLDQLQSLTQQASPKRSIGSKLFDAMLSVFASAAFTQPEPLHSALPNPPSIALHERLGSRKVAQF